jgi:hypothetical protein
MHETDEKLIYEFCPRAERKRYVKLKLRTGYEDPEGE